MGTVKVQDGANQEIKNVRIVGLIILALAFRFQGSISSDLSLSDHGLTPEAAHAVPTYNRIISDTMIPIQDVVSAI